MFNYHALLKPHMDQILVAVDGSKQSFNIVDKGCEQAKAFSSSILLVYVMKEYVEEPEGIVAYEKSEGYADAFSDYLQQLGDQITGKLAEKIQQAGIPFRIVTPSGNVAEQILNVANVDKVKMIVIGVKGLHGLALIRSLGSVTRRVVESAECPVLVVP
jgi:nucleotide-binding universal stress UspA family protein